MSKYIELIDKYRIEQRQPDEMMKQRSIDEQTNKIGKVYLVNGDTGEKIEIGNAENLNANHLADYCSKGEKREDGSNS